jgi:hypothetical protein
MASTRILAAGLRLPDGRVLVSGGTVGFGPPVLSSAEVYDPVSSTWTALPPMKSPRVFHRMTLLSDGRVLVTGGERSGAINATATTEIFDPATNTWSWAGSMTARRSGHHALLLADGRVLAAGGKFNGDTAEIYDPATDRWTAVSLMRSWRKEGTAALLPGGSALLAAGAPLSGVAMTLAERYTGDGADALRDSDGDGYSDGVEASWGRAPLVFCATMRADVNDNRTINVIDLQQAASEAPFPKPMRRMDQNGNGPVNVIDLFLIAQQQDDDVLDCP